MPVASWRDSMGLKGMPHYLPATRIDTIRFTGLKGMLHSLEAARKYARRSLQFRDYTGRVTHADNKRNISCPRLADLFSRRKDSEKSHSRLQVLFQDFLFAFYLWPGRRGAEFLQESKVMLDLLQAEAVLGQSWSCFWWRCNSSGHHCTWSRGEPLAVGQACRWCRDTLRQ